MIHLVLRTFKVSTKILNLAESVILREVLEMNIINFLVLLYYRTVIQFGIVFIRSVLIVLPNTQIMYTTSWHRKATFNVISTCNVTTLYSVSIFL